jgi:hypothetical protein
VLTWYFPMLPLMPEKIAGHSKAVLSSSRHITRIIVCLAVLTAKLIAYGMFIDASDPHGFADPRRVLPEGTTGRGTG